MQSGSFPLGEMDTMIFQAYGIVQAYPQSSLERLAEADAFTGIGLTRRDALWQVKAIRADRPLPLFNDPIDGEVIPEPKVVLPMMNLGEEVVEDYVSMRMSLRAHPVELIRSTLNNVTPHAELASIPLGRIAVCGSGYYPPAAWHCFGCYFSNT